MSWGGGGIGFGGAPGGMGRPAAPGLPFAGIPSELQSGVDRLLTSEPEHAPPDVVFEQNGSEADLRRLTLRRLLTKYPGMLALAGVLVVFISIAAQTGIDDRATLYSSTEFKKIRLLYFTNEFRDWEAAHST